MKSLANERLQTGVRQLTGRLDRLCGGDWRVRFTPWGARRVRCELTLHDVTRTALSEVVGGVVPRPVAEASAFKRACDKFGIGPLEPPQGERSRRRSVRVAHPANRTAKHPIKRLTPPTKRDQMRAEIRRKR